MAYKSYDNLYIDILKTGRKNVKTGLSYNELKTELSEDYDFDCNCIELAVKQWFYDSFHHKGEEGQKITINQLDDHLDCQFVMNGDACLKLISFETSENNISLMKKSVNWAFLAVATTLLIQIINMYQAK